LLGEVEPEAGSLHGALAPREAAEDASVLAARDARAVVRDRQPHEAGLARRRRDRDAAALAAVLHGVVDQAQQGAANGLLVPGHLGQWPGELGLERHRTAFGARPD